MMIYSLWKYDQYPEKTVEKGMGTRPDIVNRIEGGLTLSISLYSCSLVQCFCYSVITRLRSESFNERFCYRL